ncbi:MAG: leukotoxin LktA family filamentous adhesin, partial [Phascolarctobacterium sp.]|nr:leukotoxin LktA family filamentous adhesin [Phascolarctobacterium sp.]
MRMTRKIRRAWLRGKPEWAKCYLLKQRLRKQNKVKSLEEHKNRLHGYSRYLVAGVILACLGIGQATQVYASNITVKDNNYSGTVVSNGNVIDVYNQQVTNGNALNKFTNFELSQSDIANLHLDAHNGVAAADRQINLVDNKVAIDGVLNAYKNGQIGGDIYFFSAEGIAIGSTGVVNVGSLTLGTSVSAGQNIYENFTSYNDKSSLEKAKYIAGEGDISIGGSINAADNITIGAKSLTASGDAKINSDIDFSNVSTNKTFAQSMEDYRAQFMNLGGANKDALAVISKGDEIVLYGQSGVEFSSKDYVSITGTSANNIKVASNGGDVEVRVNASDNVNAKVSVEHAQITSNGGDINVSLINDVRDDVEIDIKNSTLDAKLSNNANGNVSISASTVAESLSWAMRGNSATIDITESNVKGDNVNVSAAATLSGEINGDKENTATDEEYIAALDKEIEDEYSIIDWVYDLSGYDISELRSLVAVTVVEADSQINITDSTLEAVGGTKENNNNQHGNININTYADSQIVTLGLGFINFGTTLGFSDVVSKVNIIDSNIKAQEDISIDAYGKNKIDLDYIELSFLTGKVPATVVFNMADLNSDVGVYVVVTT